MKNTLENKAKFFALYWEQEILCWCSDAESNQKGAVYEGNIPFKEDWLELTPLSQITDEDAIEVAKISGYTKQGLIWNDHEERVLDDTVLDRGKLYVSGIIEEFLFTSRRLVPHPKSFIAIVDLLRSKGYTLPYMGLSVDQQIEYGWIKLNNL